MPDSLDGLLLEDIIALPQGNLALTSAAHPSGVEGTQKHFNVAHAHAAVAMEIERDQSCVLS